MQKTANLARPKLLFLAWNFPPSHATASVRTWNVAKYLARRGWDVTVLTPEPGLWRRTEDIEEVQQGLATEGIRRILTDHSLRFLTGNQLTYVNNGLRWVFGGICRRIAAKIGVDRGVGWIKAAERACARLVPNDVDLILASGPPYAAFVLAERLSKKLSRPYVLDYRDPWTEVPGMIRLLQRFVIRLERKLLAVAAAVTTVSRSWASDLDDRYKLGSKVHVVTNGYDPEELAKAKPLDFGHFAIVYAGEFYPPYRVLTPVLAALKLLRKKGESERCYLHYYGSDVDFVRQEAVNLGVMDRVKLYGRVSRSEALSAIRGANVAVVISSIFEKPSGRIAGWVPAKVFDIMGLQTPMLLIAPAGTDIESIAETAGLVRRISGSDVAGIASFLEQLNSGLIPQVEKQSSEDFAWENIAARFDVILRAELLRSQSEAVTV